MGETQNGGGIVMRTLFRLILICFIPVLATAEVPLGQPFTLAVGESVEVGGGGLFIGFEEITEDSRCPMDAYCFWEGNAAAALWAALPIGNTDHFSLNTTVDPQVHDYEIYRITLLWVAPYPASMSMPIPPESYEVTMVVVKTGVTGNETLTWSTLKALYR
jgi:hypothetical protein